MINGALGIASGWKTETYQYDLIEIINYIRSVLTKKELPGAITPRYKNYTGTIVQKEQTLENLAKYTYENETLTIYDTVIS